MDLLTSPSTWPRASGSASGGHRVLVALGVVMAINNHDAADVITPLAATIELTGLLIRIVQVVWGPALVLGPLLALLGMWAVGSKQQAAPPVGASGHVRSRRGRADHPVHRRQGPA